MNQKFSAADITAISMRFPKTVLTVNQTGRTWTTFIILNNHGQTLYYTKINSSKITGVDIEISPSEITEFVANATPTISLLISANQTALNGTYQIRIWADSRDASWNNVKSLNYYINLTVLSSYTTINLTSSTTSSSTTTSVSTTTTQESFIDNTFSKTIGKNISKNQILVIVAIIMILLVLIPMFSFKKEEMNYEKGG